jgi:hypothetical protein
MRRGPVVNVTQRRFGLCECGGQFLAKVLSVGMIEVGFNVQGEDFMAEQSQQVVGDKVTVGSTQHLAG